MENEIWRDIENYKGLYQVSNIGRVKSVKRTVWTGRGYYQTLPERILKEKKNSNGYLGVNLYKEGKARWCYIHRLVCTAFCENPHGYKEVNHIDQNKENNCVSNLEFCSRQYNVEYSQAKPIFGISKVSGLIVEFNSSHEASRQLGVHQSHITACCKGKLKSIGGFYWYYADQKEELNEK